MHFFTTRDPHVTLGKCKHTSRGGGGLYLPYQTFLDQEKKALAIKTDKNSRKIL